MKSSLSKSDRSYFRAAQAVSQLSDFNRVNIGCVFVDKHRIISSGFNSEKGHPMQARTDKETFNCDCPGKQHAEFSALLPLIRANVDLSRATLYTYRGKKDGTLGPSRPCPRCMQLIKSVGIRKIKYTTNDGFASELII